jgi:primary-amine oxidase
VILLRPAAFLGRALFHLEVELNPTLWGCRTLLTLITMALHIVVVAPLGAQQVPQHPLDGLHSDEIRVAGAVIRGSGEADSMAVFASAQLHEPPKSEVLAWVPGQPFRREAVVVLRHRGRTYEAVVDIRAEELLSWAEVSGHSHVTVDESETAGDLILEHPDVRAAFARRGITDLATVECEAWALGYFALPEQLGGRRILQGGCSYVGDAYNNWGREIGGLTAMVDIEAGMVLRVEDSGPVPLPTSEDDYDEEAVGPLRDAPPPIETRQPLGPGFTREGGIVQWQNWRFHVRVDPRVGAIVSAVGIEDGDRLRSVMYQGSLSEIFVPYQDSTAGWYNRVYLDGGEYADGGLPEPLEPGVDCPDYAVYVDGVLADHNGLPIRRRRLACLFERVVGVVSWRHGYEDEERVDGRPGRELILRWNVTAGNYDYLLDWVFHQDGGITVAVGATGILEVRPVVGTSVSGPDAVSPDDLQFGRLLAPRILGVNHDHFFAYRLDLDVDGVENAFAIGRLRTTALAPNHPRRSLWTVHEELARTEHDAQLDINLREPALWRVVNPSKLGPVGYPVSYHIAPRSNAVTLLEPDDWPQVRAGFSRHHLWVTPHSPEERYAAGDYPTLSDGEYGLPKWTRANRSIENTDIVAWYTLGFHHVPRAEDWPIMPTVWHAFELRPFDFFQQNPIMDLTRRP